MRGKIKRSYRPAFALKRSSVPKQNLLTLAYSLPVRSEWLGDEEIEKIDRDPTVMSSITIRKSHTLKKELQIETKYEPLQRVFDYAFKNKALDAILQGFSVFELNWEEIDGLWYPKPIERDYRLFELQEERLFFNNQPVDRLKAIYIRYNEKFHAPMGRPLYHTLFWLRRFKAASISFWIEFLERFGKPWVVGRTEYDPQKMAEELYGMLGGDVAVIDAEDEIDLKTPSAKGSFEEFATYADNQIREAILGGNLLGEVQGGSYAAAKTHFDVSEAIAMADEKLLLEAIHRIVRRFLELNELQEEIKIELIDRQHNLQLAQRDATLSQTFGGRYRFSKAYLERTYNIELEEEKRVAMRFADKPLLKPQDHLQIAAQSSGAIDRELLAQIVQILHECDTYEEAYDRILQAFDIDDKEVMELLQKAIGTALLYGDAEVGGE